VRPVASRWPTTPFAGGYLPFAGEPRTEIKPEVEHVLDDFWTAADARDADGVFELLGVRVDVSGLLLDGWASFFDHGPTNWPMGSGGQESKAGPTSKDARPSEIHGSSRGIRAQGKSSSAGPSTGSNASTSVSSTPRPTGRPRMPTG
jgi:hypothetical protein